MLKAKLKVAIFLNHLASKASLAQLRRLIKRGLPSILTLISDNEEVLTANLQTLTSLLAHPSFIIYISKTNLMKRVAEVCDNNPDGTDM